MAGPIKLMGLLALLLLAIILPFALWGNQFETTLQNLVAVPTSPALVALVVFSALAADVLLPVPSSLLSAAGIAWLGPELGVPIVWAGLTIGHLIGFDIGRIFGRRLVDQVAGTEAGKQVHEMGRSLGLAAVVVLTRAVPVLSEACAIMAGASGMEWKRFFVVTALANLGVALVHGAVVAAVDDSAPFVSVFVASVVIPVAVYGLILVFKPTADRRSQK